MDDGIKPLIVRLREQAEAGRSPILGHLHVEQRTMLEAADEIERLQVPRWRVIQKRVFYVVTALVVALLITILMNR